MSASEIRSLTGLRAAAALAVLAYHLRPSLGHLFPELPTRLLRHGYLGVDVFFVLSGFILALHYGGRLRSRRDYAAFLGYRLARIYPLHLVVLLGVLGAVAGAERLNLEIHEPERFALDYHLPLHLLLMHAWGFEESLRFNLPSWSISAEFFAYALFPLFWWPASRLRGDVALAALAGASALATVVVLRWGLGYPDLHVPTHHALIRVSGAFFAGTIVYRLFAAHREGPPLPSAISGALLLGVVAVALSPVADWLMPLAACVMVYVLARGAGLFGRPLETRPALWLGRISFSIYLIHLPVFSLLGRVLPADTEPPLPARIGIAALYVAAALGAAALCYYTVELPARRWIRAGVDRRLGAPSGDASAARGTVPEERAAG